MADTHLGYSAYRTITNEGSNQREIDIYDAFIQCIDYAIKTKPDLILHAGDLFDSVRPSNRAITVAIQQLLRVSQKKIPFIIISGNHETPRLKETGNIFHIFNHLDNIYPIFNNAYETLSLDINQEKFTLHGIPHCQTKEDFKRNLKKIKIHHRDDFNIFIAHGAVTGIKEFKMNELNELLIPTRILQKEFDYIALGHYHTYTQLEENAFYSGSTEHLSFAESSDTKGFLEVEYRRNLHTKFIPISTRPMINVPSIDCRKLSIQQVMEKIEQQIESIHPQNKIVRIQLHEIPLQVYRRIEHNKIRKQCKGAVHFEIKADIFKESEQNFSENARIESIASEFVKFIQKKNPKNKKLLQQLGLEYIYKIETQQEEL